MALVELFFAWPPLVQIIMALFCVMVAAGLVYLVYVLLYALAYTLLNALNEAIEPEVFDADWMDADKWEEAY